MSVNSFFEISPKSWEETKKLRKLLDGYVFRGHADKTWNLKTNIERAGEQHRQNPFNLYSFEKIILEKFISRAHQYIQSPPNKDEKFEWLSLLQDFGGPTRLLDFTDSFYVAAFFAAEFAERDSCIWAVRESDLYVAFIRDASQISRMNSDPLQYAEELITSSIHNTENLVFPIRSSRLNERVAVQKGLHWE